MAELFVELRRISAQMQEEADHLVSLRASMPNWQSMTMGPAASPSPATDRGVGDQASSGSQGNGDVGKGRGKAKGVRIAHAITGETTSLGQISNGLLRLVGVNAEEIGSDHLSREELRTVVTESSAILPKRHKGMLLSILLVYHPNWVATFNDHRYIDSQ